MAEDINININVKGASDGGKKVDKLGSNLKKTKGEAESLGTSLGNAWGEVNILGTSLGSVSKAFKATAASGKLMFKSIKIGLISTGIGAFVIAIGSLATYFSQTKRGAELLETTLATLGAGIKVITDRIANFGGSIIKVFKGDFKGAAKDMKNALTGIGKEIKKEIKLANDLAKATINLRDSQRELNVETAQRRAEVEALKLIAEDMSLDEQVRLDAAREAFAIEQDLLDKRVANAEEELRIQQEKMAMGENTAEDLDREAQLLINVANLRQESGTKQIELNNKINGIVREIAASEKAAFDAKVAREKEEVRIGEQKVKTAQDILEGIEEDLMSETELRDKHAKTKRKKAEEAAKLLLDDTKKANAALVAENQMTEADAIASNQRATDEYGKQMTNILRVFQDETKMFEVVVDATRDKLETELLAIGYDIEELKGYSKEQLAELLTDYDSNVAILEDSLSRQLDATFSILNSFASAQQSAAQEQVNDLDKKLKSGNISQEQYEKQRAKIEAKAEKRQKRAAMIQILMDTAVGVAQAIKAGAGIPFPLNIGAIASGVAAVLAGIANAKATLAQAGGSGGGGGGGGGSSPSGGGAGGQQFESMIPEQLTESFENEEGTQPMQAYVVENDISNAQALQEELETQATL